MANVIRHVTGETTPRQVPVDSATVIEIGDFVALDAGTQKAIPISDLTYSNLAQAQEAAHDAFLGVAQQQSRAGDDEDIRVATTGEHLYPCASATFDPGDLIGPDDNAGGTALLTQQAIGVATANLAFGRVTRKEASAATLVYFEIVSTIYAGGPQASA